MKTYIRPVCGPRSILPLSIALCRTNGEIAIDSDILDHFDPTTPGKDIKAVAEEFHGSTDCTWGECLNVA